MPDDRKYTPHQKRLIRRYYENREAISVQRLGEIVSDLYLLPPGRKADRLWEQAEKLLERAGANPAWLEKTVADRDVEQLAALVRSLF